MDVEEDTEWVCLALYAWLNEGPCEHCKELCSSIHERWEEFVFLSTGNFLDSTLLYVVIQKELRE